MIRVISNSIYALKINALFIILFYYLLFYLINTIKLKKNYNLIKKFEKKLETLKKKKKIIGFTKNNIKYSIPLIENILKTNFSKKNNLSTLILGSYEGHSTLFFYTFNKTWQINCVDIWEKKKFLNYNLKAEDYFNKNTIFFRNKIKKIKSTTKKFFLENSYNFDLIYLDASHKCKDVKFDCINSWKILNINGVLIIHSIFLRKFKNLYNNNLNGVNLFLKEIKNNNYKIINITNNFLALKKIAY
jgi:hypothetical protein